MDAVSERKRYIDMVKSFVQDHQNKISSLLQRLDWSPEHIMQKRERVSCPHDSGHVLPVTSLNKHIEVCQYTSHGCPKEDVNLQLSQGDKLPDKSIFKPKKIDDRLINSIVQSSRDFSAIFKGPRKVPVSQVDYMVNFLPDQRLALYDYFQNEFKEANERLNVEKDEFLTIDWQAVIKKGGLDKDKPKTKAEILLEMRDLKRRRQTYRAKNVHITNKSYTEILREVISNQAQLLGGCGEELKDGEQTSPSSNIDFIDDRQRERSYQTEKERDRTHRQKGRSRDRSRSRNDTKSRDMSTLRDRSRSPGSSNRATQAIHTPDELEISQVLKRGETADVKQEGEVTDSPVSLLEAGELEDVKETSKRKHKHRKHKHRHHRHHYKKHGGHSSRDVSE